MCAHWVCESNSIKGEFWDKTSIHKVISFVMLYYTAQYYSCQLQSFGSGSGFMSLGTIMPAYIAEMQNIQRLFYILFMGASAPLLFISAPIKCSVSLSLTQLNSINLIFSFSKHESCKKRWCSSKILKLSPHCSV